MLASNLPMAGIRDVSGNSVQLIDQIFRCKFFGRKLTNVLAKQFGTCPYRLFRLLKGNPITVIDLGICMDIESQRTIVAALHTQVNIAEAIVHHTTITLLYTNAPH